MRVSVFIQDPILCIDTTLLRVYIADRVWGRQHRHNFVPHYVYDACIPAQLETFLAMAVEYELTEEAQEALRMLGIEK